MANFFGRMEHTVIAGIVLIMASLVSSDACKKVYDTSVHCLQERDQVSLKCPVGQKIEIQEVQYYVTSSSECPTLHDETACSLGALTGMFKRKCLKTDHECQVIVSKKADSSAQVICKGEVGSHYIGIKYRCEGSALNEDIPALSLCDKTTQTGSLVRITSHSTHDRDTTKDLRCHCKISVENNVQIQFDRLVFNVEPPTQSVCEQRVVLSAEAGDVGICRRDWSKQRDDNYVNCYGRQSKLTVGYDNNNDTDTSAAFVIEAKVHPAETFSVQCGLTQETSDDESNPAVQFEANRASITSDTNPYIIGCCLGAGLLMIIAIVIILTRKRRSPNQDAEESDTSSNYAFVKDIYLDEGIKAKQVVSVGTNKALTGTTGSTARLPAAPTDHPAEQTISDTIWNSNI
ncbi:hypothetical protein CAPTEDRAFT_198106 [Capitella teleta]|uniref:SUEL-type lectin domain-containing protein n=1 Tax=Capitella teleta TaxID=283909 RepID=X1ZYA6_CAPTE|nr:hypothetical protein CAPTEDRAFT_198106 [Capitella teleta]|eukprot:ELU04654.1 hypothetical protein CAPTEDRAFT_198106 [Capitella teleta]